MSDDSRPSEPSDQEAPKRPRPARPPRPARAGEDARRGGRSGGRPTPVREAVGVDRPELPDPERPSRELDLDGATWEVEVAGRARTGSVSDPAALVLLLTFRRKDTADPEREVMVAAPSLDSLSDLRLAELFDGAGPFRGSTPSGGLFDATRRSREPRGG